MQLVSNCYNFGLITEKHWCSYKGHYIPLAMTACSRIEINPTMPACDPDCFPQLHNNYYRTLFKSRVAFVQFVGRPQLKNGNLRLKTGSCSASYCPHSITWLCNVRQIFLHFLQSENIGWPDGDPIKDSRVTLTGFVGSRVCWGCVIASTNATEQPYVHHIVHFAAAGWLQPNMGTVVFKMGKLLGKVVSGL